MVSGEIAEQNIQMEPGPAYAAMIDSSPLPIVSYDPKGVVTSWNPAAEKTFGWAPEDAVGRRLPIVPAERQAEFEKLLRRALDGEASLEPELHRRRIDGSPIVVSSSIAPLRGQDGTIYGIMEILTDVTDRKAVEEIRQSLLMALDQAGDGIIVTDVRGVILYANAEFERISGFRKAEVIGRKPEVLSSGRRDRDFYRKLWETVISPVREPSGRIVSYIGIQREIVPFREMGERPSGGGRQVPAGCGRQIFLPRPLDLNIVLSGMERMLRRLAGKDLELSVAPGRNIGRVRATPGKVEQLVAGLAVRARDILPAGGRVAISTADVDLRSPGCACRPDVPPGSYVLLSLEALGEGVEPGNGNGSGQDAAGDIVRQLDGTFLVEQNPGHGAAFHAYLPRIGPSAEDPRERDLAGSLARGTETILLVEDEDVVRLTAREVLRTCGYTVIEARHGKEALVQSEAHQRRIHLAVTDVMMPRMDGLELANRLREARPDTKILFISGFSEGNGSPPGDVGNGTAFLRKPFTPEALSLKVREILDAP